MAILLFHAGVLSGAAAYYPMDQNCDGSVYGYPNDMALSVRGHLEIGRQNSSLRLSGGSFVSQGTIIT